MGIRISDIAKMAKVSTGTVDRVIHNRGKVSEEKYIRVKKVLKEIDYKPNLLARALANSAIQYITVVIPEYEHDPYWSLVYKGIQQAIQENNYSVKVDFICYKQQDSETFPTALKRVEKCSGVILATHFGAKVKQLAQQLDEQDIPYVFIDSNLPDLNCLSYVGTDSFQSGSIAARFALLEAGKDGQIITVNVGIEESFTTQKRKRKEGFISFLEAKGYKGEVKSFELPLHLDKLVSILDKSVTSLVVFDSKIYKVYELLRDKDIKGKISLIGYDLVGPNIKGVKEGGIDYLISQSPKLQGYTSVKNLVEFLVLGIDPSSLRMPIQIYVKENIEYI